MSYDQLDRQHEFYPAKYFESSLTYWQWCKLSIADVHALRHEKGFAGQNVYFHLNHPIQFIYLVGVIVGIEDKAGKITIIDLDDGSGACIELKLSRTPKHEAGTTTAENVFVRSDLAQYTVLAGKTRIETGTVIKAKGTITSFRDQRQLDLKRVFVVKDTNDEAAFWAAATQYKAAVLSKPWILTKSERLEIDRRLMEEDKQTRAEEQTAWLKKTGRLRA